MNSRKPGPAFPFEYYNQTNQSQEGFFGTSRVEPGGSRQFAGMSLRDYFAAKALNGICASGPTKDWSNLQLAREAYQLADAMLKARNETI